MLYGIGKTWYYKRQRKVSVAMVFIGLAAGLFGLDQYLKAKIEAQKKEEFPRDLEGTGGLIRLYRNHNRGFCFGALKEQTEMVKLLPLIFTSAASGVFVWLLTRKSPVSQKFGFSLVVAGAASNLFDRMKCGYVVDFFSIRLGFLKRVVFNLADFFILAGTAVLAVRDLFRE